MVIDVVKPHVGHRVDGHADLADLTFGARMIGVVTHLGGQIESARETGLTGGEQELEALVRRLGGTEARVLAHRPQLAAVHRGVNAARVRGLAGGSELLGGVPAGQVGLGVEGIDGNTRIGALVVTHR